MMDWVQRDIFYANLLNSSGDMLSASYKGRIVAWWDGKTPVIFSQELIESLLTIDPNIEALPHRAYRICQYRLDFKKAYPQYGVVAFDVSELPKEVMPPEYWENLLDWARTIECSDSDTAPTLLGVPIIESDSDLPQFGIKIGWFCPVCGCGVFDDDEYCPKCGN